MKLTETLCLDHFYIAITPEQFEDLKKLKNKINGFEHKITQVVGDSWEGLYLWTNSGEYIEFMIPEKDCLGLGIAFSSKSPIYTDVRELKKEFKKLKWLEGTRIRQDGSKWFTWLSIKSKVSQKSLSPYFSSWAMFYHPHYSRSKDIEPEFYAPKSMARIVSMKLSMNPELESFIEHHLAWSSAVIKKTKKGMKIEMPNREFEIFRIEIVYDKKCAGFALKELVLNSRIGERIGLPRLEVVRVTQDKSEVLIDFYKLEK